MYRYRPLRTNPPRIRLVTIEAATSPLQPIRLRLRRVEFNASLKYHTLSYTWGSPGQRFPTCWGDDTRKIVYLNGEEFSVRLNLHAALSQLRDDYDATISFWIDAICVDQSNTDERTAQVALMAQIYSGTQCNVTWFGPSDNETESAFRLIGRLSSNELLKVDPKSPYSITEDILAKATGLLQAEFEVVEKYAAWNTLASLFNRHYWSRAWVLQEVSLAPQTTMTCGQYKVSMSDVLCIGRLFTILAITWSRIRHSTQYQVLSDRLSQFAVSEDVISVLQFLEKTSRGQPHLVSLIDALHTMRSLQSSDPRDKLFAAIGISRNVEQIKADYSRPAEGIFREYAMEHMRRNSSLLILAYCEYAPKIGYSTWAPDWSEHAAHSPLSSAASAQLWPVQSQLSSAASAQLWPMPSQRSSFFSAGGDSPPMPLFRNDRNVLVLQAVPFDEIVYMASDRGNSPISFNVREDLNHLYELAAMSTANQSIFPVIGRADWHFSPSGGSEQFEIPAYMVTGESILEAYKRTRQADTAPNALTGQKKRLARPSDTSGVVFHMARRFVVSSRGYFCLVPREARLGDKIVVVKGGQVPLLLRPQQAEFQLIGECYVHGIMDGEAMTGTEDMLEEICIV